MYVDIVYLCMYVCMCGMCMYVYMHVCVGVCMYICNYVCSSVYMCMRVRVLFSSYHVYQGLVPDHRHMFVRFFVTLLVSPSVCGPISPSVLHESVRCAHVI